jgi:hypothetical protein
MITPAFSLTATERVLPSMALDFTTASLDSRITFTRSGNTATVINSAGLVTTINANLPRFNFNLNTGGVCKGLLLEEARTNLLLQSNDVSNAAYTATAITVVANSTTAPDGTLTAAKATITNTAANQFFQYATGIYAGQTLTVSFYGKADSAMTLQSHLTDSVAGQFFNSSLTTTWQRFTYTMLQSAASTSTGFFISLNTNSTTPFYIWGVQLEVGTFATSIIPTTASQVTCNADVAVMTSTNFSSWYNASEGAFVASSVLERQAGLGSTMVFSANDNTIANAINCFYRAAGTIGVTIFTATVSQLNQTPSGVNVGNAIVNSGVAYKLNDAVSYANGTVQTPVTTVSLPTITQLQLGVSPAGTYLNGCVRNLRYWKQRILNAEGQAFSK